MAHLQKCDAGARVNSAGMRVVWIDRIGKNTGPILPDGERVSVRLKIQEIDAQCESCCHERGNRDGPR
jgi:hypothetical protein